MIRAHPELARHLETDEREGLERLEATIDRKVSVQAVPSYQREQYDVAFR